MPFLITFAAVLLAHALLKETSSLLGQALVGMPWRYLVPALAWMAVLYGAFLAGWVCVRRKRAVHIRRWQVVAVVVGYCGAGYLLQQATTPKLAWLGDVLAYPPSITFIESSLDHPAVTYRINSRGFRGTEWTENPEPGILRGVMIGDSFVFGSGLKEDETLSACFQEHLQKALRDRRVEVLNLGIQGRNILSYSPLFRVARDRLKPGFAVICLTLPNDLSRWDSAVEAERLRAWGGYSFFRFVLGGVGWNYLSGKWYLPQEVSTDSPALLEEASEALRAAQKTYGPIPIWIFPFSYPETAILEPFQRVPGVVVLPPVKYRQEYFFGGHGHPTPQGARVFARALWNSFREKRLVGTLTAP